MTEEDLSQIREWIKVMLELRSESVEKFEFMMERARQMGRTSRARKRRRTNGRRAA